MSSSIALRDQTALAFLTEAMDAKHKLYVESRSRGSTPVAAARMAGFRDPDASALKLEGDMNVRAAIEAHVRVQSNNLAITRNDVMNGFLDAVRVAQSSQDLVAAWREIGKMINAYEDEKAKPSEREISKEEISGMTDDELARTVDGEYKVLDLPPVKPNAPPRP